MSVMTIAPTGTGDSPDSWDTGYTDGELAAITGLSARRALARTEMAADYDPTYADGYWQAYAATVALLAQTRKAARP